MGEPDWRGWWQDAGGTWHAPHEARPESPVVASSSPKGARKPWALVLVAGLAIGALVAVWIATNDTGQRAATTTSVHVVTARDWVRVAGPYLQPYSDAIAALNRASGQNDLDAVQATSAHLADAARNLRLALEGAGPPPPPIAVEGRALIEATKNLEDASRTAASCVTLSDCTAKLSTLATAINSHTAATQNVTSRLG